MKLYSSLDRFFLKRFSAVVAVSLAVQEKILQSGISPERVLTVRNGIDLSRFNERNFSANLKKDLGIPEHHLVVGTVGRLSSEKGHRHFLNCVEAIEKEYPQTTFQIVGDGKLREELQQSFNKENIIFTGLRNDLPELYNCMDIFVLPSLTEGLPMVLLEAMASYLPVVVTRVGDVPRVVVENETGFLVDAGDEEPRESKRVFLPRKWQLIICRFIVIALNWSNNHDYCNIVLAFLVSDILCICRISFVYYSPLTTG